MDAAARIAQQTMENRGGSVRKYGSRTTCQHRREQMAVSRQDAVSDRVNPLLNAMEAAGVRPLPCQVVIQVRHLPKSNQAVLTIRQLCESPVETVPLPSLTGRFPLRWSASRPVSGGVGRSWRGGPGHA